MFEPVKLPYSTAKVRRQQARLVADTVLNRFIGRRLDEITITSLAEYLHLKLGYDNVPLSFYALSLDSFRLKTVRQPDWHRRLRRIAAIVEAFRAEPEKPLRPVTEWMLQEQDEWSPVWVRGVRLQYNTQPDGPWLLSCLVLAGHAAEVTFEYRISQKMAYRIAAMSGFSQKSDTYRFVDVRQFVSLNLLLLIAKGSTPSRVIVSDVALNEAIKAANRKIIRVRSQAYRECPFELRVGCHRCGIGLTHCGLATQQQTGNKRYLQYFANEMEKKTEP
jgi:hypothetical protein